MNLYKDLRATDKISEQISIGSRIVETYDSSMIKFMNNYFHRFNHWDKHFGNLSKEDMINKSAYDYWMYGVRFDQQAYYDFVHKTHDEKKSYIGQMEELVYYGNLNKRSDMHLLEDKYEAYNLLKPYYKRDIIKIESSDDFSKFEDFIANHESFVAKPLGLHDTYGVELINMEDQKSEYDIFQKLLNIGRDYTNDYTTKGYQHKGIVLEEVIVQDKDFGVMSPKSLNAIRITTVRLNHKTYLYNGWMKIGVSDNLIVGESRDAIMAGFDMQTGKIDTDGYLETGEKVLIHPVSGIPIKLFQIPKWEEMKDLVLKAASFLPSTLNYVGWDVVLTPKGWVIIEGNFYGQQLWQIVYERGMKSEFENLIGWQMNPNKYWWEYKINKLEKEAFS